MLSHFSIFLIPLGLALIGAILLALLRKKVAPRKLAPHHEVAFPIFLQIGVIYAVLLAFSFSMVLSRLDETYTEAKIETTNLLTLAQIAPGFPEQTQKLIDATLIEYTKTVINSEWPKMAKHEEDPSVSAILGSLQKIYLDLDVQSRKEAIIYARSLEHLAQLRENHRMRIFSATQPASENPLILLGLLGFIVIIISYLFGMERLWVQMVLTGALIFTITSILSVMFVLINPFSEKFGITPKVFENTLIRLGQLEQE